MKNREYRVLVTLALMASLVVGNIAGTSVNVQAADNKDKSTETKKTSETKTSSSATPAKDETVYVKVDDAGNQKDVTVSDQLKNISSLGTIDDVSDLKDIKNVKGDETFSENNGKLVWQGDKKDICYQGTTTKKIPVGMKVTYELDGKKVSADDLEGKSGHLKIHYEYQNTSADSGKYTPFLMATGLLMDGEKFSNVTVDNGKVISDGDRDIVIGMGLPQLKEQLTSVSSKVDDLDIPDSFTVEADVTDYEKVEAVTVATNEVFNEVGTDKFDSLDELKDSMTELQDASNKLVSGSGQLKDGLDTLLSSSGTLVSGIDQLASGGNTLASGAESLNAGAAQVATGAKSAKDGAGQLESGAQALNDGIAQMQNQVGVGVNSLNSGVRQLSDGISKAKEGATSLENGATQVETGATQVSGGVAQAQTGATTLQQSLVDIAGGNDNSAMVAALESLSHTATPEQQEVLNSVIAGMEEQNKKVNDGINQAAEKAGNLSISLGTLGEGAKQVADGGASLQTGAGTLVEGLKELGTGANQLQTGVENMATQLSDGTKQLSDGTGALLAGTQSLNSGLGTLSAGAGQVSEGSAALSTNMKTANAGAQSVASGAGQLASGASQLNSGAAELNSGMIQFNEEGIEKLVSVFDGDVDSLLDKANELLDASKEYKNFSGIADGMDGSVKFIFVSDK